MQAGRRIIRQLIGAALGIGLLASAAAAEGPDPKAAQQLVQESTEEMLRVLREEARDGEVDLETIRAKVDELVVPHLDFITMTKLAVGRHWRDASREQKRSLVSEFRELLVRTYTKSLDEYNDQKLEFLPLQTGEHENRVTVRSRVIPSGGGEKIPVSYSLRHHDGDWQVYDIKVDGISLVTTYRSSFADIASQEGIGALIEHLRQKNSEETGSQSS